MKKQIFTTVLLLGLSIMGISQVPQGFNYQAIARDSKGEPIANITITVRASIVSGIALIWEEEQEVQTNAQGLFSIVLCSDDKFRTGGSVDQVTEIPWSVGDLSLGLKIDAGQGLTDLGSTPLRTVPYSMVSGSLAQNTTVAGLEIQANKATDPGEALFIVRKENGYPVFGVYEDGVRVYTDDTDTGKGIKGGFAVGGYQDGNKGLGQTFMTVTADSTRIYVNDAPGKGIKGGFAVGGYQTGKAIGTRDYLRVTQDSTRVYVSNDPVKGLKGGFAVGGYQSGKKGSDGTFMSLEKENYFIGHNSGSSISTGLFNSVMGYESGLNIASGSSNAFLGYQSGYSNTEGSGNLFLGYQSGYANTNGNYNTFLGYQSGLTNFDGTNNTFLGSFTGFNNTKGSYNTFVGDSTGYHNAAGNNNTFLGTKVGFNNTWGESNVFIGNYSGYTNDNGFANVFIGLNSGYSNVTGGNNVFLGTESGYSDSIGWDNIYIGTEAGYSNEDGAGNLFMGYQAGHDNIHGTRNIFIGNRAGYHEKGSEKLYISNWDSDSTNSLIWGSMGGFTSDVAGYKLRFNAPVGINYHPGTDPLTIYKPFGSGTISLFGDGDGTIYSSIKFHADTADRNDYYAISHAQWGGFNIIRQEGESYLPRYMINADGNVGVNTYAEDAQTFLVHDPDASAVLTLRSQGDAYDYASIRLEADQENFVRSYNMVHNTANSLLFIYDNGTYLAPRMLMDSLGNLTLNQWVPGTEALDVNGNARFRGVGSAGGGVDLLITPDGTLTTNTSDARLKTDFRPLEQSLEKVIQMEGVTFSWKDDEGGSRDAGLVAQEVAKIFPEAVFENPNDGYLGINYSRFPALFIEAFKEQQQIINKQESEIQSLKTRLEALEEIVGTLK